MSAASRSNAQLNLPPSLLSNRETESAVLPKREQAANQAQISQRDADDLSARLVDIAISAAGLTNAEVGFVLDVSESLVRKMRSPQNRERMSHAQMLRLGFHCPRFYVEMNMAVDQRTGWFRSFAFQLQQQAQAMFALVNGR